MGKSVTRLIMMVAGGKAWEMEKTIKNQRKPPTLPDSPY